MIKQIENNQPDNVLRIEYMLGNTCNQKCSYCFPGSNEGDQPWPDIDLVKQNFSHLLDHYKRFNKTSFNIFFVGGEPTLWKDFIDLCKFLKSKYNCILEISTNGTRSSAWWNEASQYLDHVNISVHHEYVKINKIVRLADYLYDQGVFVNVDVLIDPNNFNKCTKQIDQLTQGKNNWPIVAKIVHYAGLIKYTAEQLEYFREPIKQYPDVEWFLSTSKKPRTKITITKNNNEKFNTNSDSWITRNNLNRFKNWKCNLGVDHIKIFHDGKITGNCQQTLYGLDFDYNLYDLNFNNIFVPEICSVICSKNICSCTGEIGINKCTLID
jgi:molybdenum cofactor biosynthesis enzyme MoaA